MNSKVWKVAGLFVGLVTLDQAVKLLVPNPVMNPGFFLGSFGESSAFYRIFCTSVVLAITILATVLVQFLMWTKFPRLVWALGLFQAGLVGNSIDKIWLGQVRDYLIVPGTDPAFVINLADIYLWISMASMLYLFWRDPQNLWPKKELRDRFMLYPRSQTRMITVLLLIGGFIGLSNYLLLVAYLKAGGVAFEMKEVTLCFALFTALIFSILFVFGALWSNRIYGPFKAIERYLRAKNTDKRVPVRTRVTDEDECLREILSLIDRQHER